MWTVAPVVEGASPEPGEGDGTEETLRTFDVVGVLSELSPAHSEVLVLAYFGGSRSARSHTTPECLWVRSRAARPRPCAPRARMLSSETPNDRHDNAPKHGRSED